MSNWINGNLTGKLSVGQGERGRSLEYEWQGTKLGIRQEGEEEYQFVNLAGGGAGREIELQVNNGYIQWKYKGEISWNDLISIDSLKGTKGDKGEKGEQGLTGQVGPRGEQGPKGDKGEKGEQGIQGVAGKDGKNGIDGTNGINGQDGANGKDGVTPNITIGTVTTLEAGEQATVTREGTNENPIFNFGIPKGKSGANSSNSNNASIDDNTISTDKTWSSSKIEDFVLTNVGTIWQEINGGQMVIDSTMDGFLREVEILGNTIQNQDDLSDIQHLGVWNEDKQGYEIEILVSNSSSEDDLNYQEFRTTIVLPCQIMKVGNEADRLYWDRSKGRYVIEKNILATKLLSFTSKYGNFLQRPKIEGEFNSTNIDGSFIRSHGQVAQGFEYNGYNAGAKTKGNLALSFYSDVEGRAYPHPEEDWTVEEVNNYIGEGKNLYAKLKTPELIDTDIREELKLPTFINNTYITINGGIQGSIKAKAPVDGGKVIGVLQEENTRLKETNNIQDELINTTMLATDEMYIMLEPLLAETLSERSVSKMVDMYVAMVQRGIKTIDQVPVRYREQVKKILDQLEK